MWDCANPEIDCQCGECRLYRERRVYRDALEAISEFGKRMPGHGYSCARMADRALAGGVLPAQRIEARSDEIPQEARPEGQEPVPKGAPKDWNSRLDDRKEVRSITTDHTDAPK